MRYTLLDLTQDVLSSMDSDEINSIGDTPESQQVVAIIKTVYNDIVSRGGLELQRIPFNLASSGDVTKPVLMTRPTNIDRIDWIKYDKRLATETDPNWDYVQFLPLENFVEITSQRNPSEADVDTFVYTGNGFSTTFFYHNDTAPTYYTSLLDNTLVFDSHDRAVDTTLQSSKTLCFGTKTAAFTETDGFVPELQPDQFALLLNEAKSLAWAELKQVPHPKAEVTARKNWVHLAKTRRSIPTGTFYSGVHSRTAGPNFGRK